MEYAPEELTGAVDSHVSGIGYELVDLRKRLSRGRTVLQVRIDRVGSAPQSGVTADDCAEVSRALEAWFDDTGLLGERYVLEVSSPGIERPVRFPQHWKRFAGEDVRARLRGKGRVRATIVRVPDDETVVLKLAASGEEQALPMRDVCDATLVVDWSKLDRPLTRTLSKESQ